ncbi:MAG: GDPmannose 4,6-dehydratase [Parcubacteria group bacterium Athens1014_10]|nr:MAG: GDPmannose 4,6-dehydratase [Parcubacteria group bacterium Athens1014_10]TSD05531.1 MAG: GDPmannose 4,6-dehydratase [Parcubacteria group bacterium Athens0714_12]
MKVLITGITGFVGSHLADYILNEHPEAEIHGIKRWRSISDNVKHLGNKVIFHDCDIKDAHNVYEIIERVKPEKIFHLAAQRIRPSDVQILIGDNTKFVEATGWRPEISFLGQTLNDLLNYWREKV